MDRFAKRSMEYRNKVSEQPLIALHKVVTVRQVFPDRPRIRCAGTLWKLRRWSLSLPTACLTLPGILMNIAPLSQRFTFHRHINTLKRACQPSGLNF